jgi:hypothetical protein
LANNALAIRIIFPSVRVIQVSFNLTGLPASLGKQTKTASFGLAVFKLSSLLAHVNSCKTLLTEKAQSEVFHRNRVYKDHE